MSFYSVIIPVYFNEESLPILYEKLTMVAEGLKRVSFEFIFVDDGSADRSFEILIHRIRDPKCGEATVWISKKKV